MPPEMIELLKQLVEISSSLSGLIFVFIGLPLLWRSGILKFLWNKNNGKNNSSNAILQELSKLETNHLVEITDGLKRIEEAVNRADAGNRLNFTNLHNRINEVKEGIVYLKAKSNGEK